MDVLKVILVPMVCGMLLVAIPVFISTFPDLVYSVERIAEHCAPPLTNGRE